MSGGSYEYAYFKLSEFADELREEGGCYSAHPDVREAFRQLCYRVSAAMMAIEWNDSGDGAKDEEELILNAINYDGVKAIHENALSSLDDAIERAKATRAMLTGEKE